MTDEAAFFLVWNPQRTEGPRHRHPTHVEAKAEATRLAKAHAGQRFYVLRAEGFAEKPADPPIYRSLPPELPF